MPLVHTIADWSAVFRDVDAWRPLVLAILRRHQLVDCYAGLTIRPGEVAGTHAVFVVGHELVVKLYGPFWPEDQRQELTALALLARSRRLLGGVKIPQVLASGVLDAVICGFDGHVWPYSVLSYLPGRPLGDYWPGLAPGERHCLAMQLGTLLARLHRIPLEGQLLTQGIQGWTDFVQAQIASAQQRHRSWQTLPDHLIQELPSFLESVDLLHRPERPPVLLHCDVTAEHLLLAPADSRTDHSWQISGLIDFGDAMIGDAEYDFLAVYLSALTMDRPAFAVFLKAYGYPPGNSGRLGTRLLAYMLLHPFPVMRDLPPGTALCLRSVASLQQAAAAIWPLTPSNQT